MNLLQSFKIALDMLRLHKMRAFLTMLGVIIGVMAVTSIIMISNGFQAYMADQFSSIGARSVWVVFDPGMRGRNESRGTVEGLKVEDAYYLKERIPALKYVSSISQTSVPKVRVGEFFIENPRVYGQDEYYDRVANDQIEEGRLINKDDIDKRASVAVIGTEIRDTLFPDKKALGKYIVLPGIVLEVVGVMKRKDVLGQSNSKDIRMPLTTYQYKWSGEKRIMMISAEPEPEYTVDYAQQRIWEALMAKSGNKPIYRVQSNESISQAFTGVLGAAGVLLSGIAALSLLVGGIGIMNIMLVSVTERTREIGLRKALGARGSTILSQFLVESATLSLVGGLIGMGIAFMLGKMVTLITVAKGFPNEQGLPTPFPIAAGLAAAIFSAAIGVLFGLYPAYTASKLDPIVALRRE
jgi:putative ABC transport system permease protein